MTEQEHLFVIAAEECAELAKEISKTLRFGPNEIMPGQPLTNVERVIVEFHDLLAAMEMLVEFGAVEGKPISRVLIEKKKEKVRNYMCYSEACGVLTREAKC